MSIIPPVNNTSKQKCHPARQRALCLAIFISIVITPSFLLAQDSNTDAESDDTSTEYEDLDADLSEDVEGEEPTFDDNLLTEAQDNWQFHSASFYTPIGDRWDLHNTTKVGLTITTGNGQATTVSGSHRFMLRHHTVTNALKAGAVYARSSSGGVATTSVRFLFAKDKLLWEFHYPFYAYLGGGWLTDRIQGINSDVRGNGGGRRLSSRDVRQYLTGRAGLQF